MEQLIEHLTRGNVAEVKVVLASVVLALLAAKLLAVRLGSRLGRFLPALGISLAALLAAAWLTSAGDFLGVG